MTATGAATSARHRGGPGRARRPPGARRCRPRRSSRHRRRRSRPERQRQVDPAPGDRRASTPGRGLDPARRPPARRGPAAPAGDRPHVPGRRAVPSSRRGPERRLRPPHAGRSAGERGRARRRVARPRRPRGPRASRRRSPCRVGSGSGSRWPGRSRRARACCCSTSRSAPSTARCTIASSLSWASCSLRSGRPRCTSRTTWPRRSRRARIVAVMREGAIVQIATPEQAAGRDPGMRGRRGSSGSRTSRSTARSTVVTRPEGVTLRPERDRERGRRRGAVATDRWSRSALATTTAGDRLGPCGARPPCVRHAGQRRGRSRRGDRGRGREDRRATPSRARAGRSDELRRGRRSLFVVVAPLVELDVLVVDIELVLVSSSSSYLEVDDELGVVPTLSSRRAPFVVVSRMLLDQRNATSRRAPDVVAIGPAGVGGQSLALGHAHPVACTHEPVEERVEDRVLLRRRTGRAPRPPIGSPASRRGPSR